MLIEEETQKRGRQLEFQDYVDIARRNKAWIVAPLFAALVISVVAAFLWPDTYISVATIRVAPPQVPESFVPANTNQDVQGRVNALMQLILNRATLTNIINTHGLYKDRLSRMPLEDVIDEMKQKDIQVLPVRQSFNATHDTSQYPAFEIRFAYGDRFIAQKVTADLVARFLEENVREVSQQTVSTTQFLQDQWEESKKKLDELEERLSAFRARNMGRLPEEQQSNYQELTALQAQKLNLNMAMNRVNQERLLYENQLRIDRDQAASLKDPATPEQAAERNDDKLQEKDHEIAQYESSLAEARARYKETHPDVQRLISLLNAAHAQRQQILNAAKQPNDPAPPASAQFLREQRELNAEVQRTQGLLLAKGIEMEDYRKQSAELDKTIEGYESRIEGTPVEFREYDELIRDRDLAKKDYEDLDKRLNSSEMSTALQNRQQGERLEQLDPPSLPQTPAKPKRVLIVTVGTGLGFLLGLCIAGLRELRDTSLRNVNDAGSYWDIPVIGSVPVFEDRTAVRRRKRLAWCAWAACGLTGFAIMSASVAHYYISRL